MAKDNDRLSELHDALKMISPAVQAEGNALMLVRQAAVIMHQDALEEKRSHTSLFLEEQAKKLDKIWQECFYYKHPPV